MDKPMVMLITERSLFKGTKYVVVCAEHGRIAKRYLEHEATSIGVDHAVEHIHSLAKQN